MLTYVANHSSTVTAWLRVLASAQSCSVAGVCPPVTEDSRLCDDTSSVACRIGDEVLEDDRIVPDVLPVLLGCRAEMDDVCARQVSAEYGQQLVL
jgi:hypothetical protein